MSGLPRNWVVSPIGDLISLNPKIECPDELPAGFVPMQMVGKEYSSPVRFETRPWGEIKKGYTHFANGDVLLAKITPCFENGKAGLVCGLPNGVGAGSTEYFVSRPHLDMLNSRYLYAFLKTEKFLKAGAVKMTGSVGHKRVPKDYLLETELPLAPLPEQQRIANKLDAVLARVDACRDRLERIPAILKRFRQSVLSAATSGKLTEEWREQQGLEISGKRQGCIDIKIGKRVHEDACYNYDLHGWKFPSIGERCNLKSGKTWPAEFEKEVGEVLYAKVGDMNLPGNELTITTSSRYLDQASIKTTDIIPCRSIIFPKRGGAIATNKKRLVMGREIAVDLNTMAIICPENLDVKFLYFWLLTVDLAKLNNGSTIPQVNNTDIAPLVFPEPPLNEQTEIVRRVEALFACADRLEARYAAARTQVEKLTPATLAKAFRGELVPQDPNDEPASKLLGRICASRDNKPRAARR